MFNDNRMGNSRNAVAFVEAYFGKKSTRWNKKYPFPFPAHHFGKDIGGKNCGRTAAAASTCVGVLSFTIIDQNTTVLVDASEINILFIQKIQEYFFPIMPRSPVKTAS